MQRVLIADDDRKPLALLERGFRYEGFEVCAALNGEHCLAQASDQHKTIDSGPIAPGKEFTFAFTQAGRFVYRCAIHPTMLGIITVQAP